MPNTFQCPACGQMVSDNVPAGMQIKCPLCQNLITVPAILDAAETRPAGAAPTPALKRTGMANTSLTCGILGLCVPLVNILAIVFGIIALRRATRQPSVYGGRGLAIGGICIGTGGIVLRIFLLLIMILLPSLARAREQARLVACASNLRQISTSIYLYTEQNQNEMPAKLEDLLKDQYLSPQQLRCPSVTAANKEQQSAYTYIPGQAMKDNPQNVLVYENLANHKGKGINILFLDGHVQFVKPAEKAQRLIAETKERVAKRQKATKNEQ